MKSATFHYVKTRWKVAFFMKKVYSCLQIDQLCICYVNFYQYVVFFIWLLEGTITLS